jgi:hypothetical protein
MLVARSARSVPALRRPCHLRMSSQLAPGPTEFGLGPSRSCRTASARRFWGLRDQTAAHDEMAGWSLTLWSSTTPELLPPAGPSKPARPPPLAQWAPTPARQGIPRLQPMLTGQGVAVASALVARTEAAFRAPPSASVSTALGVCAQPLHASG